MFAIDHVIACFPMIEDIEKERPFFTQEQKQSLYRIAFHAKSLETVQKLIMQAAAPNLSVNERNMLLQHYLGKQQELPDSIKQIENYIFQLQHMTYEKNKANQMLEDILKHSNLERELDALLAQAKENPVSAPERSEKVKKEMVL
ncbi:MAG: hypothetical protein ACK5MN_02770 [Lachnospiraceae bacterium]